MLNHFILAIPFTSILTFRLFTLIFLSFSVGTFFPTKAVQLRNSYIPGSEILNVKEFGAKGDNKHDDTEAILLAISQLKLSMSNSSNIIAGLCFPPGIYIVSKTIRIPPKCRILGIGGVFSQEHYNNRESFFNNQSVVLRLADNADCNMIEPDLNLKGFAPFEGVIIENLVFDGNKSKQGNGIFHGVYLEKNAFETRPNFVLRNILVTSFKGNGFSFGANNSEFLIENVFSLFNDKNGFLFEKNEDVNLTRVGAGGNNENGFYFDECSAFRLINCDAWINKMHGTKLVSSYGMKFSIFQCDNNFKHGLYIQNSALLQFSEATFQSNSREDWQYVDSPGVTNPKYSDVYLNSNSNEGYGSYGISFMGCRFGSMDQRRKTKFGIFDHSFHTRANVVIGSIFIEGSFSESSLNEAVSENYLLIGNSGGNDGEKKFINPAALKKIISTTSENIIYLREQNEVLCINTASENFTIYLPAGGEVSVGKEYEIIKESENNAISIVTSDRKVINNGLSIFTIQESYKRFKILNTGLNWIVTQ